MDWATSQPRRPAVVADGRTYSYRELADAVLVAAARLADRVGPGTRVGLYLDSTPEFVIYEYAVFHLGGVVVPINRAARANEVDDSADQLDLELVVVDGPLSLDNTAVVQAGSEGVAAAAAPRPARRAPDDHAMILQTSGSTGRPKGVALSFRNLTANYDATPRWLGVGRDDRILLALPLFNTYALNQGVNLAMNTGATLRLVRRFGVEAMARALEEFRPTFLPLVPTMLTRLADAGVRHDEPLTLNIGASASPSRLAADAWQVFPQATLLFGYGLTEATAIVTMNRVGTVAENNGDYSSAGRAVNGVEVRVDSIDTTGRGEVLVRGDSVFAGYVGTADLAPVENGWLRTGDIGVLMDGVLTIVDRKRDLIIRGGQNIYPGELERALTQHDAVLEAAVVGIPDSDLGEVPTAFVVLRSGAEADPTALLEWLTERVAGFKVPAAVTVIEAMPKTPTGKIQKRSLLDGIPMYGDRCTSPRSSSAPCSAD
ncbi:MULTISPECIES: AMP-binding protein [unclassified Pseudonocardia]|uniref:class I adenylate-forming enzyme family protein n=1 Tax=unclassified Pseudonocardia TaxID=2619320 RepID=UPI0001FFEEAF|nr:AMP-binding protein [Pseudonocardia sp. Ae707_Ps1]